MGCGRGALGVCQPESLSDMGMPPGQARKDSEVALRLLCHLERLTIVWTRTSPNPPAHFHVAMASANYTADPGAR